jgi:hypothetical protein
MASCFVVQGFGEKTDLPTGRKLNLDASYLVIKEAVEDAGLQCVRADEIVHAGTIDKPMYQWLFDADLVIADLSTYNVNAAYELGVRYGVRPGATIIVAEDEFKNPFDVSHIVVRRYKHLGEDIGVKEARRFKQELAAAIREIVAKGAPDSPVYTYLDLQPPVTKLTVRPAIEDASGAGDLQQATAKDLLDQARAAIAADDFVRAKALFGAVHALRPRDDYVIQQLALATYKCKRPDLPTALVEAQELLQRLDPAGTNNPETLGLWGAVHKRLCEITGDRKHLDTSINGYERGFYLKQDYYNGINLAFLLNVRADLERKAGDSAEAIADFVLARRVRRQVIPICESALQVLAASPTVAAGSPPGTRDVMTETYWITATLWEAAAGLEDTVQAQRWEQQARALKTASWMVETTTSQIDKLTQLLTSSPLAALNPVEQR